MNLKIFLNIFGAMIAIVFVALSVLSFHYSHKMTIDSPEMAIDLNEKDFFGSYQNSRKSANNFIYSNVNTLSLARLSRHCQLNKIRCFQAFMEETIRWNSQTLTGMTSVFLPEDRFAHQIIVCQRIINFAFWLERCEHSGEKLCHS